jgi:NAD-dependent SIR2 family protein deacetylase
MAKKKLTIKDFEIISVRQLAYKIKEVDYGIVNSKTEAVRAERKPKLAFFLGAGASRDSGIITAGEMMKIFRDEIFEINCEELKTDGEKAEWLKVQNWYKDGKKEYGCLFERFRDSRSGRQIFIEKICHRNPQTGKLVEPSFGYVVLADLLLRNYVNTVVTTNFDDLVYIAATTFTGNRPIVYAYGILASEMKITDAHSKVLKIHGDYLYSNIVNLADEMTAQSDAVKNSSNDGREIISHLNMERQVRTVLDNFGLIVVGYSGGDKTIMDLLELVSEHNGFYWCFVKNYPPDEDVLELVKSKNGKLVEINGFDDMMKGISDITGFSIEDLVESFKARQENLVKRITEFNDEYTKRSLGVYADELTEKQKEKPTENLSAAEYFVMAFKADEDGDYNLAEKIYRKAIKVNPNYMDAYNNLGNLLINDKKRLAEAEEIYRKAIQLNPYFDKPYYNLGILLTKDENRSDEAEEMYRKAIEINPNYDRAYYNLACLWSESRKEENKEKAFEYLKKGVEINSRYRSMAKIDPDFDFVRDDERFGEIVGRDEEE